MPYLKRWLQAATAHGVEQFEVGNVGAYQILADHGLADKATSTDFTLYALNNAASQFWGDRSQQVTLSIEDDRDNLVAHLKNWQSEAKPQVILYKDTPLFIAESCSLTALHGGCPTAKVCGYRDLEVENAKGERFIVAHESCKSIVYGKQAYAISEYKREMMNLGVAQFRVDFLTRPYETSQIEAILSAAASGKAIPDTYPANFNRTLL